MNELQAEIRAELNGTPADPVEHVQAVLLAAGLADMRLTHDNRWAVACPVCETPYALTVDERDGGIRAVCSERCPEDEIADGLRLGERADPSDSPTLRHFGPSTLPTVPTVGRSVESVGTVGTGSVGVSGGFEGWAEPRPLAPEAPPPPPVEALPAAFREMVEASAAALQTDPGMPLTFGLGVLSAAVGPVSVSVKPGWCEPVGLYVGVVARPGEAKSPALAMMAAPLHALEREEIARTSGEVHALAQEYDVRRKRLEDAKNKAGKAALPDAERYTLDAEVERCGRDLADAVPPEPRRLIAGDVTPERAATLTASQGGRLAIVSDEPGVLGPFLGRYTKGDASLDLLLSGWSSQPITVDRKGDPQSVRIERPALTIVLGIQPTYLRSTEKNDQVAGRGFVERFLLVFPVSRLGLRSSDAPGVPDDIRGRWDRLVRGAFQPLRRRA